MKIDRSKWPAPLRWLVSKWAGVLVILGVWITLASQVGGSEFILEEALQQTVFAAWFAEDAGRYDLILQAADLAEKIQLRGQRLNRWFGWINPFAKAAYGPYFNIASPLIIQSMRVMAANQNGTITMVTVDESQWEDPERIFGRAVLAKAIRCDQVLNYLNQVVTVLVPVVDARKKPTVAYADSNTDFSLTTFPREADVYNYFPELGGKWVLVSGKITVYEKSGKPQIIINNLGQILAVEPLIKGG